MAEVGSIRVPSEIYFEIVKGGDNLTKWVNHPETMKYFVLDEEVLLNRFNKVVKDGYGDNLPDWQLERIKIDATLIAYALGRKDRVIVTREVSSPAKKGQIEKFLMFARMWKWIV